MTFPEFDKLVEETFEKIRVLMNTKGKEYANSETERLANFKEIAEESGVSPLAVLNIYVSKHTRAISNYCKTGASKSNETIESRILDRIVYDFLLLGLIEDLKHKTGKAHEWERADINGWFTCRNCKTMRHKGSNYSEADCPLTPIS